MEFSYLKPPLSAGTSKKDAERSHPANQPEAKQTASAGSDFRVRTNKAICLRKSLDSRLKSAAVHSSMVEGRRITEFALVDEALQLYFEVR
jgi:hypothetical protein